MEKPWKLMHRHERLNAIRSAWFKDCSAADIAQKISKETNGNISRHAILGTYHRNPSLKNTHPLVNVTGQSRRTPVKKPHAPNGRGARRARAATMGQPELPKFPAKKFKIPPEYEIFDGQTLHLPLDRLSPDQCHWGVNSPALGEPHLFCGLPITEEGTRYCPEHKRRSVK